MPNFCINFLNKAAKLLPTLYDFAVASLADAWIKINHIEYTNDSIQSHPSRMRGLKRNGWVCGTLIDVASLADAWIKINNCTQNF